MSVSDDIHNVTIELARERDAAIRLANRRERAEAELIYARTRLAAAEATATFVRATASLRTSVDKWTQCPCKHCCDAEGREVETMVNL